MIMNRFKNFKWLYWRSLIINFHLAKSFFLYNFNSIIFLRNSIITSLRNSIIKVINSSFNTIRKTTISIKASNKANTFFLILAKDERSILIFNLYNLILYEVILRIYFYEIDLLSFLIES